MSVPDHLLGFLNIAKPHGVSSRSVVDQVQKHLRLQTGQRIKVGHSGTLDPFADGVLILGVGRATSLLQILQHGSKSYQATFCLGKTSETLDLESPVESVAMPDDLSSQQIEETLVQFLGDIQQVPPKHSAIRVAGKRAYELARKGRDFAVILQ